MQDPDVWLQHCTSDKMRADIFTKALHQKDKWYAARTLINILDPSELPKQIADSAHDLSANDKPISVWDKANGDKGITKGSDTFSAMEVDHDPQGSENLVACAATPRVNSPRSTGVKLKSMRSYVRTLIEVCCDANSKMGIKFEEAKGVRHIRVTLREDFLKMSTAEWILSLIDGESTLIWFSMPCTGGCPWIYLNRNKQNGPDNINDHRKIMKMMWRHFEIIAKHADKVNAWVVNEWQLNCQYWEDPKVRRFFQIYNYDSVVVHGCMAGLRSVNHKDFGMPVKKPWKFMTNKVKHILPMKEKSPAEDLLGPNDMPPALVKTRKLAKDIPKSFAGWFTFASLSI